MDTRGHHNEKAGSPLRSFQFNCFFDSFDRWKTFKKCSFSKSNSF